jgi:hypothetical protein
MTTGLKRRELLGVGLVTAGLAGVAGLRAGQGRNEPIWVVRQPDVPESIRFSDALAAEASTAGSLEVGPGLDELFENWPGGEGVVAGLTSDPVAMIARQLLVEAGATPVLRWDHSFAAGRWTHRISGRSGLAGVSQLTWPAVAAMRLSDEIVGRAAGPLDSGCASDLCGLSARSPGFLVTWAFRLKGGFR